MPTKQSKSTSREKLIEMVRDAFKAADGRQVTFREFLDGSGMKRHQVFAHFPNWAALLRATGLAVAPITQKSDHDGMLADWGNVVRKLGRYPTHNEYGIMGRYNYNTLRRWFASWPKLIEAFQAFARDKSEWADVLPIICKSRVEHRKRLMRRRRCGKTRIPHGLSDRPSCGPPIGLDAMRHAPTNETGVVYLFGIVARQLGFVVDSLHANFPDCQAKREISADVWKPVAIEFEYESRNFELHRHPVDGCDMIVCWRHNWKECPRNLEVVALEDEIKKVNHETRLLERQRGEGCKHEEHEGLHNRN